MKIQPIKNESQYDLTLAEIDRLWGFTQGTPDGDRLDGFSETDGDVAA